MINDRKTGTPRSIQRMTPWLLIVLSIVVGGILFEIAAELILPGIGNNDARIQHLIYFFDGPGSVFRDYGETFTYMPDSNIRVVTISYSPNNFSTEYDYHIQTNNFGLVQDTDIKPGESSLLLLGDSFTEGVGAEPWFRSVGPEISKLGYQPINGGIGGTGFRGWLKLDQYLTAAGIRIRKIVVLFISDDYRRPAWNVTPGELRCFSDLSRCQVDESSFFRYRLPPPEQLSAWVSKIRAGRERTLGERARALVPATFQVYEHVKQLFRLAPQLARDELGEKQSRAAIAELIRTYGPNNVAFIHLPQKEEIGSRPNELGLMARRSIQQAGGKLFDGFTLCGLTQSDYHPNDLHPNSVGYAKIAACTLRVIRETTIQESGQASGPTRSFTAGGRTIGPGTPAISAIGTK